MSSATGPLSPGTHTVEVHGLAQRYHVYGQGAAVCVAVPGGPGVFWEYLRMPAVEQHVTMVYVEPLGTGESGRLATHPHGYTRAVYADALDRVIGRLGREKVHLLGHSHGGFVAQYYAAHRPERLAGLILYASSPVTGEEQGAETVRQLEQFVRRNDGNAEVPAVLAALESIGTITDDDELTAALRGLVPANMADYWAREEEFAPLRARMRVSYVSGLDADGIPDAVADRDLLPRIGVPTFVIAGRYDVLCGERWGREIHDLVPDSRLLVLEHSGHLGHLEEADRFTAATVRFVAATDAA